MKGSKYWFRANIGRRPNLYNDSSSLSTGQNAWTGVRGGGGETAMTIEGGGCQGGVVVVAEQRERERRGGKVSTALLNTTF